MNDTWRSERLLYRAYEGPGDDEFMHSVQSEPEVFINSIDFLPRPWSAAEVSEASKRIISASLLYVVVCKIPEAKSTSAVDFNKETESKKPTPTPIGFISLCNPPTPHSMHHRSSQLGIMIAKEHQGNRYGPEAIKWILNWGFKMAGLHRVGLMVYEYNVKAQKVYKSLGFVEEGREREGCWYNGKWWDIILMGIIDREWESL